MNQYRMRDLVALNDRRRTYYFLFENGRPCWNANCTGVICFDTAEKAAEYCKEFSEPGLRLHFKPKKI